MFSETLKIWGNPNFLGGFPKETQLFFVISHPEKPVVWSFFILCYGRTKTSLVLPVFRQTRSPAMLLYPGGATGPKTVYPR